MSPTRIAAAIILSALLFCACGTTGSSSGSPEASSSGAVESVTVGGEIQIRGQHLD